MSVSIVEDPTYDIDLDLVKKHCRVDDDGDDTLLGVYIDAACGLYDGPQGRTGYAFWPQTLEYRADAFEDEVRLPCGPVSEIVSVIYLDADGAEQTLDAETYVLGADGYFRLADGAEWPTVSGSAECVRIQYETGYATPPDQIVAVVMMTVAHWYANREAVASEQMTEVPMAVDAILRRYWRITV